MILDDQQNDPNQISVIIPVPDSPDNDYGLLLLPKDDFAIELGLKNKALLENDFYKIVENESSDALPVGDFDGDNVLYHLMKAHDYYLSLAIKTGAPTANFNHKITVRVRVDHDFNSVEHFSQKLWYDNSCYITNHPDNGYDSEIWFFVRKAVWNKLDWYSIAMNTGSAVMTKNYMNIGNILPDVVNKYSGGIDTAKLPNVIYHENFHWASDYPNVIPMPDSGNQVGEDYANYFGSSLGGKPTIAELKEFSGRNYTRHYQKVHAVKDPGDNAANPMAYNSQPFVPSLFWQFRDKLGQARGDELVYRSLKFIRGGIFETLIPAAILDAVHEQKDLTPDEVSFVEDQIKTYTTSFVNLQKYFYNDLVIQSDPGTLAIEANITDAVHYEDAQIKGLVNTLREEGVEVTSEDEAKFGLIAAQLKTVSREPGFARKVLRVLGHAGIKVGEIAAYSANAAGAVLNAPVHFATELSVSSATGHSMGNFNNEKLSNQLIGAAGGLGALYYLDVGLSLVGNPLPLSLSLTGVMIVETVICTNANTTKKVELKNFCAHNEKVISSIYGVSDKAGDVSGLAIHRGFMNITHIFHRSHNAIDTTSKQN
jgi:hypothetical protein